MTNLHNKYKTKFQENKVDTPIRLAYFFASLEHESPGLKPRVENLNYSKKRLLEIFRSDFDVNKDRVLSANEIKLAEMLANKPEQIANFVYANQNGNGGVNSGDGWKFRGRYGFQLTGRKNYELASKGIGVDLVSNPDEYNDETHMILVSLWFWNTNKLWVFADKDDLKGLTRKLNGGLIGIDDRLIKLKKWKSFFKIQ